MMHESPLRKLHETYVASLQPPGVALQDQVNRPGAARGQMIAPPQLEYLAYGQQGEEAQPLCEIIASFGEVEAEYAAIRRGAGLMDNPQRSTLMVKGTDRREFLNSMLTQELKDLSAGMVAQAFWLNRKGRIEADLRLFEFGEFMLIDVDICQASGTVKSLTEFVFTEDVQIQDVSEAFYRVSIHGPRALEALVAGTDDPTLELENHRAISLALDQDGEMFVGRVDQTGEIGLELFVPRNKVTLVWERLINPKKSEGEKRRVRPVGWYSYNIARIEAGTPVYNVDFSEDSLAHETGILPQRVSFTKGCYLGQEIVARMESLGRPKRVLVGLKLLTDRLPAAGGAIYEKLDAETGDQIGIVTSSTLSPMLGAQPVGFGIIKTDKAAPETIVLVDAEGEQAEAVIGELRFLPTSAEPSSPRSVEA